MNIYIVFAGLFLGLILALGVINAFLNEMKPEILVRNLVAIFIFFGFIFNIMHEGILVKTDVAYIFFISGISFFIFILISLFIKKKQ